MAAQTKWEGLWKNKPGIYRTKVFSKETLEQMPEHFRIIVKENYKYTNNNDGTPRFVFCFADKESEQALPLEVQVDKKNIAASTEMQKVVKEVNAVFNAAAVTGGEDAVAAACIERLLQTMESYAQMKINRRIVKSLQKKN